MHRIARHTGTPLPKHRGLLWSDLTRVLHLGVLVDLYPCVASVLLAVHSESLFERVLGLGTG
jgi:hypothetical protein